MMSKSLAVGPGSGRQPAAAWAGLLACACLSLGLAGGRFSVDGPPRVQEVALADLNGDGSLDAYLTINPDGEPYLHPDYVLFNDGLGRFTHSGQEIGNTNSFSITLGDVDGDGAPDAVAGNRLYRNDGLGTFRGGAALRDMGSGGAFRWDAALGDLNGDGTLDIFGAACCGGAIVSPTPQPLFSEDAVWFNDDSGSFRNSGQRMAPAGSNAVGLGDLDGDGTLDAFIASGLTTNPDGSNSRETPNTVWLNDGSGGFTDSGQRLGQLESTAVAMGDVDGDGDLDAAAGNRGRDEIWLNDGRGAFSLSGERLDDGDTRFLFLADLNGDGVVDLFSGEETEGRVWLNDGRGRFRRSGQEIHYEESDGLALGDLTGDGVVDIFVAGVEAYQVWSGAGNGRFAAGPRRDFR